MTPSTQTKSIQEAPEDVIFPPGNLWSDEPPLESSLHLYQILLLLSCLNWLWGDRTDYFAVGNLTVYYSPNQLKSEDFRGPDFLVVLGTEKRPRRSWVVWEEDGKYPNVIVELLSKSTAKVDRGLKKEIYQDTFRTPDYFWFDPETLEFEGFHLVDGAYHRLEPNEHGWRWSQQLQLYLGIHDDQLRFFTPDGELVPTPEESAEAERQKVVIERERAEAERERAETERERAEASAQRQERLAAKLRELGVNPDDL
ncbi:MAG: Uma2 family endonuclease [Leptolyngbyaceae bacterium]|nr:Uma2 family endonuclease [Leptolyngbyaceae bacterium]